MASTTLRSAPTGSSPEAGAPSLSFRPDPAAWLAELDRAPRSRRQAAAAPARTDAPRGGLGARAGRARAAGLVGLMVALALAWSIAGWVAGPGSGVDPVGAGTTPDAQAIVVVQPGDTLWSIAAAIDPDGDVRATVDRLAERNGGSALTVGQRLVVSE